MPTRQAAEEQGISAERILPTMDDWEVFPRVATAVAIKARQQGIARLSKPAEQVHQEARAVNCRARDTTRVLMREGIIPAISGETRAKCAFPFDSFDKSNPGC